MVMQARRDGADMRNVEGRRSPVRHLVWNYNKFEHTGTTCTIVITTLSIFVQ